MAPTGTNYTILNPDTPLAYLAPDVGVELEVSRYIYMATLGAYIWDILVCIPQDYRLLFKFDFTAVTFAYFTSRVSALLYILINALFQVSAVPNCNVLQAVIGVFYVFTVSSSSFLFFLRVRAIFNGNSVIIAFFALSWLSTLAGSVLVPIGIRGAHIASTQYCVNSRVPWWTCFAVIFPLCNDAFIFTAISWRIIVSVSQEQNWKRRLRVFFGRSRLPAISRAVLQTGQQYYVMTLGGNIVCVVLILTPSLPAIYHAMMTIPNIAILSSMACRVYRQIKLGILDESTITTSLTLTSFSTPHQPSGGGSGREGRGGGGRGRFEDSSIVFMPMRGRRSRRGMSYSDSRFTGMQSDSGFSDGRSFPMMPLHTYDGVKVTIATEQMGDDDRPRMTPRAAAAASAMDDLKVASVVVDDDELFVPEKKSEQSLRDDDGVRNNGGDVRSDGGGVRNNHDTSATTKSVGYA